jgi:hypothetical protein
MIEEFTYDAAGNRLTQVMKDPDTAPPTGSTWATCGRIHSLMHHFGEGMVFYYAGNPGYSEDSAPVLIENGLTLFEVGLCCRGYQWGWN